jgi:transcriptional regulator with XRE-family HTH domain
VPKKGHQYPIDDDWKQRVRDRMKELEITQNELARQAKISKASLSAALATASLQSAYVPEIHRALGWRIPPLVLSPDVLEMVAQYDQLDSFDRGVFLERLRTEVAKRKRGRA